MFEELKGKRLLILGGSLWKDGIKEFCDTYGITIIAAGNDPESGIVDIADEYYNVNSTDSIEMKKLIASKDIDGVYMGGNEPVISSACQYIHEMGFPCYCTKEQWDSLQNKKLFKSLCIEFELPVTKEYEYSEVTDDSFPLITKPADGYGSNGFTVCRNMDDFRRGYKLASDFSATGSVIIEQYVQNNAIGVFYNISEGRIIFTTIEDKYPVQFKQYGTFVGGLYDFESNLADEFRNRFEDKIQRMINKLKIKEGNFWIEIFYSDGNYYFNEVGFRYGGSGSLYPVDYFSGINQVATDIYYALTSKSKTDGFIPLYDIEKNRNKRYAIYPIFLSTGVIGNIDGLDVIRRKGNVLKILSMKHRGSVIPNNGSFGQVFGLFHFTYSDINELKETIRFIHNELTIRDIDGNDMILELLDVSAFNLR